MDSAIKTSKDDMATRGSDPSSELKAKIEEQGNKVRQLKSQKAEKVWQQLHQHIMFSYNIHQGLEMSEKTTFCYL